MNYRTNFLLLLFFAMLHSAAQELPAAPVLDRIKDEGLGRSQVDKIAHYLTDVAGPRLTNSPGYIKASNWAVSRLKEMGLSNAHLDSWGKFGPGWMMTKNYLAITQPYYHSLVAYPNAWTKGTTGLQAADVVLINALDADSINTSNVNVQGKIVMVRDSAGHIPSPFKTFAGRFSDDSLTRIGDTYMMPPEMLPTIKSYLKGLRNAVTALEKKGALALLSNHSWTRDGTVEADSWWGGEGFPKLLVMNTTPEDYFRIQRLVDSKIPVRMEVDVATKTNSEDQNGYNVIAEIPGTDPVLKKEVVMLGAHLDSWYSGTGATDNAAGSAVMMEAVRILMATGLKPKRTIRIALWSGEEQGLFGSTGYVRKYLGDPATLKLLPQQANVSAYFNLDNGTGKIRGIYAQNNEAVAPVFEQWVAPIKDLGATTVALKNTGSTDHLAFDAIGIPAFEFIQDPIEYETRTHHTNMDVYDHLLIDDLKQASTVVAWFVYNAANRADKLPRKALPAKPSWIWDNILQ